MKKSEYITKKKKQARRLRPFSIGYRCYVYCNKHKSLTGSNSALPVQDVVINYDDEEDDNNAYASRHLREVEAVLYVGSCPTCVEEVEEKIAQAERVISSFKTILAAANLGRVEKVDGDDFDECDEGEVDDDEEEDPGEVLQL